MRRGKEPFSEANSPRSGPHTNNTSDERDLTSHLDHPIVRRTHCRTQASLIVPPASLASRVALVCPNSSPLLCNSLSHARPRARTCTENKQRRLHLQLQQLHTPPTESDRTDDDHTTDARTHAHTRTCTHPLSALTVMSDLAHLFGRSSLPVGDEFDGVGFGLDDFEQEELLAAAMANRTGEMSQQAMVVRREEEEGAYASARVVWVSPPAWVASLPPPVSPAAASRPRMPALLHARS